VGGVLGGRVVVALAGVLGGLVVAVPGGAVRADAVRDREREMFATLELGEAWKASRGRGVVVGVVDSGADVGHPDLKGAVTEGPDLLDDFRRPFRRHGTAMSSIIAGHGHGAGAGDGVEGVAPEARVLAVRAVAEKGEDSAAEGDDGQDSALAGGIRYVVDHGARVVNMSLGEDGKDGQTRRAVAYAISRGVVVVASVGNDGGNGPRGFGPYAYPAAYPGVVGVAATGPDHQRAPFSNRNYSAVVAAPGVDVPAAWPGDSYALVTGTSPAAAIVSGVVALIRARDPALPPAMVTQALIEGTRHRPEGRYSPDLGFGEVDGLLAVRAADRLAALRGTGGMRPDRRFGGGTRLAPVRATSRPTWVMAGFGLAAALSLLGLVVSTTVAGVLWRRRPPGRGSVEAD
jgi:subtilisin family serine protease